MPGRRIRTLHDMPREELTGWVTPIEKLDNLTKELGGPTVFIKRDDLLGGTAGGNKTRKLEFVLADALKQGATTLITCGAPQSNHCRLTASAAKRRGLKCRLVLEEREKVRAYNPNATGNNLLYHLLGVEEITVVPSGSDIGQEMMEVAERVKAGGGKPYIIPGGASYPLGAAGYAACAEEIIKQANEMGIAFKDIVVASGSAGTHAGLVVGLWGNNSDIKVTGINVMRKKEEQERNVYSLVQKTAEFLKAEGEIPRENVACFDDFVGPGYSLPTKEMVEAVELLARAEGILLDPVYTGKAMAGLIGLARQGHFKKGENVLFLHTGGSPAIFDPAYSKGFFDHSKTKVINKT